MIRLLGLALFVLPLLQERKKEAPPAPDPALVKATLEAVDKAWKSGATADKEAALRSASEVPHPDVVAAVKKGLKDREKPVQLAALDALRRLDLPVALEALHETYKHDQELRKDEELETALLKAIGQH